MNFEEFLAQEDVVILDGGMSTALEEEGLTMSNPIWNAIGLVAAPKLVGEAHRKFFDAGANVVVTNTYFCSSWIFKDMGFTVEESQDYLRLACQIARKAREVSTGKQAKFIAGGVSCYGVQYSNLSEYTGAYDQPDDEYYAHHKERFDIFEEEGVDLLAIETIPNYRESLVLLDLLREYPDLKAYFSSTLSDPYHLGDGHPYADLQKKLEAHPQIIAYGTNCVKPDLVRPYLEKVSQTASKPLLAYPNGFGAYDPVIKEFTGDMVDFKTLFKEEAESWRQLGCRLIGGCCGSDAADIRVLAEIFHGEGDA
ncbi:homocysteine S-methyltransferase [Aerococcus sp. UMB7834]|uniref:homocysteine S-methyltransferase n=1 Tax=Aerococcus sp. UMB7834 TaxID=3046342 RepID=UPI00254A1A10|nr:homocysteine S-methyltransferase [Aerococcus sp. UMB7834]MDK6804673.1 homocysteine S-methyltransferase [Aerococcus sp. UMB7834]